MSGSSAAPEIQTVGIDGGDTSASVSSHALALTCTGDGAVRTVYTWSVPGLAQPEPGTPVASIVDRGSATKFERFLARIQSDDAAFDWQMNVPTGLSAETFSFTGVKIGSSLVITAAVATSFDEENEFTRINNELSNLYRRLAQQNNELAEQRNRLQSILTASPVALIGVDRTGSIRFVNEAAATMTGLPVQTLQGMFLKDAMSLRVDGAELVPTLEQLLETFHFDEASCVGRSKNEEVMVSGTIAPIRDSRSEIIGRVISLFDLTVTIQHREMVLAATLMQSSKRITAGLAHNINNLMTIVLAYAQQISGAMENGGEQDSLSAVRQIEDAAHKAASLAGRMMYYTQDRVPQTSLLNPQEITSTFLRDWDSGRDVRLVVEVDEEPVELQTEREQIETLVYNLVQNAVEACENSGTVTVSATVNGNDGASRRYWSLTVADTGSGMDAETRAHMFEPFFTTRFLGRGLGLAAVDGIVHTHGGEITVLTAPGRGTRSR